MIASDDLGRVSLACVRFRCRISLAAGRSVRARVDIFGRQRAKVMSTIPQSAPSSRMLRVGLTMSFPSAGRWRCVDKAMS